MPKILKGNIPTYSNKHTKRSGCLLQFLSFFTKLLALFEPAGNKRPGNDYRHTRPKQAKDESKDLLPADFAVSDRFDHFGNIRIQPCDYTDK